MKMNTFVADEEQFVADLAWDYCEKARNGEQVLMKDYLARCPNGKLRTAFKDLVNADLLLQTAVLEPAALLPE